jgi:hypothetical protein
MEDFTKNPITDYDLLKKEISELERKVDLQNPDIFNDLDNVFYISLKKGNDLTGNGGITNPYKTFNRAIAQIVTKGDNSSAYPYLILASPGNYAEDVVLDSPALKNVFISAMEHGSIGLSVEINSLVCNSNNDLFSSLTVSDIRMNTLLIEGASNGTNAFSKELSFRRCMVNTSATIKNTMTGSIVNSKVDGNIIYENITGIGELNDTQGNNPGATITIRHDDSAKMPAGGLQTSILLDNTISGTLIIERLGSTGIAYAQLRKGTRIGNTGSIHSVGANCTLEIYTSDINGNVTVDPLAQINIKRYKTPNEYHIDSLYDKGIENGSIDFPYSKIQSALDDIGDSTNATEYRTPQTINIASGFYDEDILIPKGHIISIMCDGTWTLGDGLGSGFGSTIARNVTINVATTDFGVSNVKPSLNIGVRDASETTSTFIATSKGCHISGDIIYTDTGGISNNLNLCGVKVYGDILKVLNVSLTNLQMYKCYVRGSVNMPGGSTILEIAESCEFDGLIDIDGYNRIISSEMDGGMIVRTIFDTLPPSGMFMTGFSGTFNGPSGSLKLDSYTNKLFISNGSVLTGGATKVHLQQLPSQFTSEGDNLVYGTLDPFGRMRLWHKGSNSNGSILQLGSNTADGDPDNRNSEGIVVWFPGSDYSARIKANRFGLSRATNSGLYLFRVDDVQLFFRTLYGSGNYSIYIDRASGKVGFDVSSPPTSKFVIGNIQEYPDNASAISAGEQIGAIYRTGDVVKIVH